MAIRMAIHSSMMRVPGKPPRTIRRIIEERLAILQTLIEKKQRGEPIVAADLDAGKSAMDGLRDAVARVDADEKVLLSKCTATLNRYTSILPAFFIVTAFIAVVITGLSYRNIVRDYREKERLRPQL
ncbi:hypothetical protein [Mucilaginibacter sp.]|uniref:hypothetical protein n=1 Tax=Mucilaginibacter sp. TaxID=1882438 RepID=UPI00260A206F|nr:hypothetical protein [Mucilaginibacter sp.]MDB5126857.1 luxQ 3 [Mucilaginibacter sp.]